MEGRKKKNGKKSVDNKLLRSVTGYARDTRCDDRESWGQKCFSLLFLKGRREEGGSHARDLIRRQGRTRVSRIPAAQLVEILLTTIRKYRTVKEEEKEKRVSTKPFPSCASTLADTGCYATHELDAMHSGWACGDFIITSSLPTECIRIEKCAGLFFSYRGYRDNARMPVTRARIHPSFGRERERFPSSRLHRSRFFSSFRHGFQAVRVAPSTFVEKVGDVFRSPRDKDNEREREREGS